MQFFLPELFYYTSYYFLFTDRCRHEVQTRELLPLCNFLLVPNVPNFFDYLLPTDIAYCFKYNVILCQLFFQQTGAVKTLPPHNPISLILSFFLHIPMNSQFDLFVLTKFLFNSNKERLTNNISLYSLIWITRLLLLFNQLLLFKFCSSFLSSFLELKPM